MNPMTASLARRARAPGWPVAPAPHGIGERFRAIPDELWKHRGLFLLIPGVLTAAWFLLLSQGGFGLVMAVAIFARLAVFAVCIADASAVAGALEPAPLRALGERSRTALVGVQTAALVVGVVVGGEVALALFRMLGLYEPGQIRTLVYGLGLIFGFLAQALTFFYDAMELRAEESALRAERADREALEARLQALQARTNPHFLFNSLNTIAGLVSVDPEGAERAIETLSEVMRYALESTETPFVSLDAELEAVRNHLAIEGLRYGDRLKTKIDLEPGLGRVPVPPLSLQPVVENAVLHGIAQRETGGTLAVSARREGEHLVLRVDDDGPGPDRSDHSGSGTALRDLRSRLALLYGEGSRLDVCEREDGGCRVELRLPLAARRPT